MKIQRRPVRIATVSHRPTVGADGVDKMEKLMKEVDRWLDRASRMGAELVAFPEIYPQLALADPYHHAEPSDGGTIDRVRELAKRYRMIIIWPRVEYEPSRGLRNTSILVDRSGEILGRYDKMFPTVGELEKGIVPGTKVPVFETDLGRVGMIICFDMNFQEVRTELRRGKPDLVVFSSMYRGGLQALALAFELGAFVVTSVTSELGLIVDRCGRIIKESTYEALAVAPVNTNSVALHMDFNWGKMDAMLAKYGPSLTFDYHTREAFYVIEFAGDRDIRELVDEFQLETADAYFERSRRRRAESLARFDKAKTVRDSRDGLGKS
ncbi:MAG: carbon-nitrogen hydrolase family protein [Isosphaeraceae bacterium]